MATPSGRHSKMSKSRNLAEKTKTKFDLILRSNKIICYVLAVFLSSYVQKTIKCKSYSSIGFIFLYTFHAMYMTLALF